MADVSPAEIMLNNSITTEPLIRQLRGGIKDASPARCYHLSPSTKAKIAAYQSYLQGLIDELTAQREKTVELVRQIPDQTAQEILLLRYGLTGSGRVLTWLQMEQRIPYSSQSLYRYHKKGIAQLNQILENGG